MGLPTTAGRLLPPQCFKLASELWGGCRSLAHTKQPPCLDPGWTQQRPHCCCHKALYRLSLSIPEGPPTLCLPGHWASHRAI